MFKLRILGSPGLVGPDGREVQSVVQQPKRLALLSYLAMTAMGGYVRRDRLLGLFWPGSTERRARSSLSEALSKLRRSLGDEVLVSRGDDEVGVDADHIWCDAIEMGRALEAQDWQKVAELYRGPLLDGLVLDDLHDLEQWLSLRRGHYRRAAVDAVGRLADAAVERGDPSAPALAERALELAPFDDAAVRRVMRLLAAPGRRAAALDAYQSFADRLRSEKGMEPSDSTTGLMEGIRAGVFTADEQEARPADGSAGKAGVGLQPLPDAAGPVAGRPARPGSRTVVIAAAAVLVALLVSVWAGPRDDSSEAPVLRYALALPDEQALDAEEVQPRIALSPDGTRLAYVGPGVEGRGQRLWLRSRDELRATPVPGSEGATSPFFSPDGSSLGFVRRRLDGDRQRLMTMPSRAAPVSLVDEEVGLAGASWGADGYVYYDGLTAGGTTGVMRVPAGGGLPEQVTKVDVEAGETDHVWPAVLPGARGLLFTILRGRRLAAAEITLLDLDTGERRPLVRGVMAKHAGSGHLLFVSPDGALWAVAFDETRLELAGDPFVVAEGVKVGLSGAVDVTVSRTGTLAYVSGSAAPEPGEIVWVDHDGRTEPVASGWYDNFGPLALSRDGSRLAVSVVPADWRGVQDIYVKELPAGPLSKLTFVDGVLNLRPEWTPDGEHVSFHSDRAGEWNVYSREVRRTSPAELLVDREGRVSEHAYTADGEWLVYVHQGDLYARRTRDGWELPLVATDARERGPVVSPNARWLAYGSTESGTEEVYVSPFPDAGAWRRAVSSDGGFDPLWAPDGSELYYKTPDGRLVARAVGGDDFELGSPRVVYTAPDLYLWGAVNTYDVGSDGRPVLLRARESRAVSELVVVERFDRVLREQTGR